MRIIAFNNNNNRGESIYYNILICCSLRLLVRDSSISTLRSLVINKGIHI